MRTSTRRVYPATRVRPSRRPASGRRSSSTRRLSSTRRVPTRGPIRRQPVRRSRQHHWSWLWVALATALGLVALAFVGIMIVRAHASQCRTPSTTLIEAAQTTAEEGYDPTPPPALVSRADRLSSCAGGTLLILQAAGSGAQVAAHVSLRVYRDAGQPENDPIARGRAIRARIGGAFRRAFATPAHGDGRNLIGLLAAISQDRRRGTTETWLSTLGLPTVAPADSRILIAADPAQAAASIRRWLPDLHGVRVHLILDPPAGDQPQFNTATDNWRRAFVIAVLRDAGATIASITEVQTTESPALGAPAAPPVPDLPEMTPRPPKPPQPAKPYRLKLDSAAFFLPNSTAFATSRHAVLTSLAPVIAAWKSGGYARAVVVGRCARFGPPHGARVLSRQRADIIAGLLRAAGVTSVKAIGVGYSRPLPPNPYSAANRVVIVTIYPKEPRR